MSDKLPTVVTPGLVRNLLKTNFKLRLPGDPLTGDLKARVVTLLPQVDFELTYREFQQVLPELLDLERRGAVKITRYPDLGPSDGVSIKYNSQAVAKASTLNFVGNLLPEDAALEEGLGTVRVRFNRQSYPDVGSLPADPVPGQSVLVAGQGFYYDATASRWLSETVFQKSWRRLGTSSAITVELDAPWSARKAIYVVELRSGTEATYKVLNAATRAPLLSSSAFGSTLVASGVSLLAVRESAGDPVANPEFSIFYREAL